MFLIICLGLLSTVYGNGLKYKFEGEYYDPTPLPKSVWREFPEISNSMFPAPPPAYMPMTTMRRPNIVFPSASQTYAAFYNRNRQQYDTGYGGFDFGFGGNAIGHGGSGIGFGGSNIRYGDVDVGYGGSKYGYGGSSFGYGGSYYGNGASLYGYGVRGGGASIGYGGSSKSYDSASVGYGSYGGGVSGGYGYGSGVSGGGYQEVYEHGVGEGYRGFSGRTVIMAPQLSNVVRRLRKEDIVGRRYDMPNGGVAYIEGMRRTRMADGRGAHVLSVRMEGGPRKYAY